MKVANKKEADEASERLLVGYVVKLFLNLRVVCLIIFLACCAACSLKGKMGGEDFSIFFLLLSRQPVLLVQVVEALEKKLLND